MKTLPFLLEIGTEEIPDWMIGGALEQLAGLFSQLPLPASAVETAATPRRLVLRAALPPRQADTEEVLTGPPVAAGEGAAAGFARKLGVEVSALRPVKTARGEYLSYTRKVEGRPAAAILSEALPGLVLKIAWPKTMYWTGKGGPRFIRPIRWLVALLGSEVVPFEIAGVATGAVSSGHRRLGARAFRVSTADYEEKLRANHVLVSALERRARIEREIANLLDGQGLQLKPDPALLETLVNITEYPTPILGEFDRGYLTLPAEVLVTVMRHHQKYFSVADPAGNLAPCFIAVMNTAADPEGLVRRGNERVLRARFNDARFFWDFDQHRSLAARVDDLAHVTFQAELGSYLQKSRRTVELVRELGGSEDAARAAMLAKCDLTTEMVKEFTDLQGIVGGLYARAQGEPEAVATAIYEHYRPLSMEDSIPSTAEGRLLSLADKVDTLRGCFGIGLIPSGSRDPFALRRAAQGVVRILVEGKLALPLGQLAGNSEALADFFRDRVEYYFREVRGLPYDEVRAAMAPGFSDLPELESRLEALHKVRPTEDFEPLAAGFKRIKNILRQAEFQGSAGLDEGLIEEGPERRLAEESRRVSREVAAHRRAKQYLPALEAVASLRPVIDLFFDKVLVNAPDPRVRQNRLALLAGLLTEFSSIADFSEIVT